MRYLKVLLSVLIFFIVMLFFVQNQASFDEPVVLTLDLLFVPVMQSIPMPLYAIMLLCFTFGGLLILLMLMWDRISLTARCSAAKSKANGLQKKLEKADLTLKSANEKALKKEEILNAEIAKLQQEIEQLKTPVQE